MFYFKNIYIVALLVTCSEYHCLKYFSPELIPCNIPKITLDQNSIIEELPEYPVIYVGSKTRNMRLSQEASKERILNHHGSIPVVLSSSNTYSHDKIRMTLSEYINTFDNTNNIYANESFYLFGNNHGGVWKLFEDIYELPPCKHCRTAGAITTGLGGQYSGVSFHYHGPGFSEVIKGSKAFFLYHPNADLKNSFDPNITQAQWVWETYTNTTFANNNSNYTIIDIEEGIISSENSIRNKNREYLYQCIIYPGEMLYFPDRWMHATLNMNTYNFFVSLFLDLQLMKN
jgi:hypothetical protein